MPPRSGDHGAKPRAKMAAGVTSEAVVRVLVTHMPPEIVERAKSGGPLLTPTEAGKKA
jgi:hypothetical protein